MKKIALLTLFLLTSVFVSAEDSLFNVWGSGKVFRLTPVTDGILLGTGIGLSGADLILDNVLEVNRQKYDGTIYNKNNLNSFDRYFMHEYSKSKDKAADCTLVAGALTPLIVAASTDKEEWLTQAVMLAETMLITNGIKELTKLCVNRTRPYMYYSAKTWPKDDVEEGDFANSFPSGHSSIAFALATYTSYTFWKYNSDSKWKIPVAGVSYAIAGSTAALRVMSGNHFVSDVLTGAAIGTLTGFLVPWIHTFKAKHNVNIALMGNGASFTLKL